MCKGVRRGKKYGVRFHWEWSRSRHCEVWWVGKEVGCLRALFFPSWREKSHAPNVRWQSGGNSEKVTQGTWGTRVSHCVHQHVPGTFWGKPIAWVASILLLCRPFCHPFCRFFDRKSRAWARGGRLAKKYNKNPGPGRMAETPRAGTGDFACRSWRYQCSIVLMRQGFLSMINTFLISSLHPPDNRG